MFRLKRIIIVLLIVFSFSYTIKAQEELTMQLVSREVKTVMGVQHQKLKVKMRFKGRISNQQINYMGANPTTNPNISVVALDNYGRMDFNRGTILAQIYTSQYRYPNQKIVSAVNGDFFDISSSMGQSATTRGPHIRDGNVIFEGYSSPSASTSVGIKVDGTPFIMVPELDSYHIEVIDEEGSLKLKDLKVKINQMPTGPNDLAVFLPSFNEFGSNPTSEINGRKMFIKIQEQAIHRRASGVENGRYFVRGQFESIKDEQIEEIPENTMVLVGDDFFLDGLITETDTVRLHKRPSGAFKDVYHAISGPHRLIVDGQIIRHTDMAVHPRTAAGLKADGTLFFVVVDGRQSAAEMDGVTLEELGEIMNYFGAYQAFNLDGGGSSTIAVLDEASDTYKIHNSPSDGNLRQDGNGIGFIYGPRYVPLPPIPYPDTRTVLNQVNNLIVEGNKLMFNSVPNANRYVVTVNGKRYETTDPELTLDLNPGLYDVNVKAYGDHDLYAYSKSDTYNIEIYSTAMQKIMDGLLNYGKNTHSYLSE